MRRLFLLGLVFVVSGCAGAHVSIDEKSGLVTQGLNSGAAASLSTSSRYCQVGNCSRSSVLMLVLGRKTAQENAVNAPTTQASKIRKFIFSGSTLYDGRVSPKGPKYLSYRDAEDALVCQGYYSWSGFGRTSEVKLRCFADSTEVTGDIRTIGLQPKGRYKGRGMGTGVLKFDGGVVALIYGLDPVDLKSKDFLQLWIQHGGAAKELPVQQEKLPKRTKRAPRLNS